MLPSLVTIRPLPSTSSAKTTNTTLLQEPEDIFTSALGLIFIDDVRNQHGDPGNAVIYKNSRFGDLQFRVADPEGEEERTKFAGYVWNAGVLMGEVCGGRGRGRGMAYCSGGETVKEYDTVRIEELNETEEENEMYATWAEVKTWWLTEEEDRKWSVDGHTVLELGAGVGIGGIVSALAGAKEVAITDYPAPSFLNTIRTNVCINIPPSLRNNISVHGHLWGNLTDPFSVSHSHHYTRILAADCLWLSSQHANLAASIRHFLSPAEYARAFVVAGFHTGRARVAHFFLEAVPEAGLAVEEIWEMDADGARRLWDAEGEEGIGERKRWCVVARLMVGRREEDDSEG